VFDAVRLHAALAAVAIALLLWLFFTLTRTGKSIRAAADNHLGALVVGLDVRRPLCASPSASARPASAPPAR
jgi:branched-chain amino acid transport system permease protein